MLGGILELPTLGHGSAEVTSGYGFPKKTGRSF